jgi:hypothetical protein
VSQAQDLLKALSKILEKKDNRTSKLADSIVDVLEIERKQEQNRVIAILERLIQEPSDDLTYRVNRNDALCQAIALIKGDNK